MNIVINIGNSNIYIGGYSNSNLKKFQIAVNNNNVLNEVEKILQQMNQPIKNCIIASVKPKLTQEIYNIAESFCYTKPFIASIKNGFLLDYSSYDGTLGIDRAICCEAAYLKLQSPFIMVDFGTAITINLVDYNKTYLGGMILPGIQMGLSALSDNTSLLPNIEPEYQAPLIGKNTKECLLAGAIQGTAILIDNVINKIFLELCIKAKIIITGGSAELILPYLKTKYLYDKNLLVKGLLLVLERLEESEVNGKNTIY